MGYHKNKINKGTYGEISKIQEELEELQDAQQQNNKIMQLVELSDIIGAIQGFLTKHHPNITLNDLIIMADATNNAFKSGDRKDGPNAYVPLIKC